MPLRPFVCYPHPAFMRPEPGDLVQVDTLNVLPLLGGVLKQFTASEVTSCWDVLETYCQAISRTASRRLDTLPTRCRSRFGRFRSTAGANLLPPSSRPASSEASSCSSCPRFLKVNGTVEQANRTHIEKILRMLSRRRRSSDAAHGPTPLETRLQPCAPSSSTLPFDVRPSSQRIRRAEAPYLTCQDTAQKVDRYSWGMLERDLLDGEQWRFPSA